MTNSESSPPEIFFGDANPAEARIYVRMPPGDDRVGPIAGQVYGPHCQYARTLPAATPLRDLGPGSTRLAEAIVPDPCFWTPESPHLYRVEIEIEGERFVHEEFGIRPLAARGRSLWLAGERIVLRGAVQRDVAERSMQAWHEAEVAMLADDPPDVLCREASRLGVLLVAQLGNSGKDTARELGRLARWPAVGAAVLDAAEPPAIRPPNLLLAQSFAAGESFEPAAWADLVVCPCGDGDKCIERIAQVVLPVIVVGRAGPHRSADEVRGACARLQRDLAPQTGLAGYFV